MGVTKGFPFDGGGDDEVSFCRNLPRRGDVSCCRVFLPPLCKVKKETSQAGSPVGGKLCQRVDPRKGKSIATLLLPSQGI